jgi:hypothetical protein
MARAPLAARCGSIPERTLWRSSAHGTLSEDGKHDFHNDDASAVTSPTSLGGYRDSGMRFVAEDEDTPAVFPNAHD